MAFCLPWILCWSRSGEPNSKKRRNRIEKYDPRGSSAQQPPSRLVLRSIELNKEYENFASYYEKAKKNYQSCVVEFTNTRDPEAKSQARYWSRQMKNYKNRMNSIMTNMESVSNADHALYTARSTKDTVSDIRYEHKNVKKELGSFDAEDARKVMHDVMDIQDDASETQDVLSMGNNNDAELESEFEKQWNVDITSKSETNTTPSMSKLPTTAFPDVPRDSPVSSSSQHISTKPIALEE
jgi:hypothetical protein